ncbi:hypothetical protein PENTCL1PPCAC_20311, partial [Pristionchus entomophagus]
EVDPGERGAHQVTEGAVILGELFKQREVFGDAVRRSLSLLLSNLSRPQTLRGEQERLDLLKVVHPLVAERINKCLLEWGLAGET